MSISLNAANHQLYYHALDGKAKSNKSLYELSREYSKYLGLLRLPFRVTSTLLGWVKILPISKEIRAIIGTQDAFIRSFNSTLKIPKFFLSQIDFYHSCSELNKEIKRGGKLDVFSPSVKTVFYSFLGLSLSSIKLLQFSEKSKWTRLSKIVPRLPVVLAKSSNILIVFLVGSGLLNNLLRLDKQVRADYSSGAWASEGLSPKTIKMIKTVASKSLSFIYILTTTAS